MGRIQRSLFSVAFLAAASTFVLADVSYALPNYPKTATFKYVNPGGPAANDLHVSTQHTTVAASSTTFTTAALDTPNIGSVTFTGGSVAPGGTATVTVTTKFRSDTLDKDDAYWTLNGAQIGALASAAGNVKPNFVDQVGGTVLVQLVNPDAPINYSNLGIFTNADQSLANQNNYLNVATATGSPVALLVPANGILPTGTTNVAVVSPTMSPGRYDAGLIYFDGDVFGMGANFVIPEPAAMSLLVIGGMWWGAICRRRRAVCLG